MSGHSKHDHAHPQHHHHHGHAGHGHAPHHGHGHEHGHSHDDADFDWAGMADRLSHEAELTEPIVVETVAALALAPVHRVADLGCGPGTVACALAQLLAGADVTGLDSAAPLLTVGTARAASLGLSSRVRFVHGDLEALPPMGPLDLAWAGMVLHHVGSPLAVLRSIRERLRPGGALVMIEFAGRPSVLPPGDPASSAWQQLGDAAETTLHEKLGHDPLATPWPALLAEAGFERITDQVRSAVHPAPLSPVALAWLEAYVDRGVEWAEGRLFPEHRATLQALVDHAAQRKDLSLRLERRVLTARKP